MQQQQILFVDDDQFILEGLRRVIFCSCDEWDADFATSGQEALEMFEYEPYVIVVSDMRMPGMDGNELLKRIRREYPDTIRLILSGQAENEDILRAFGPAHHFISKPCNAEKLRLTINRIVDLDQYLKISRLEDVIGRIPQLDPLVDRIKEFYATIESELGLRFRILSGFGLGGFGFRTIALIPRINWQSNLASLAIKNFGFTRLSQATFLMLRRAAFWTFG